MRVGEEVGAQVEVRAAVAMAVETMAAAGGGDGAAVRAGRGCRGGGCPGGGKIGGAGGALGGGGCIHSESGKRGEEKSIVSKKGATQHVKPRRPMPRSTCRLRRPDGHLNPSVQQRQRLL